MKSLRSACLAFLLTAVVTLSSVVPVFAVRDEGMYTPPQIAGLELRKKGLKIKPEEIYNPAGGGLTEAVIRLSIGCTAEFVSPQGLILTNHHCAFDALVKASDVDNDLVENGFKADNRGREISAEGFSIFITERTEDVTAKIRQGTENLSGEALTKAIQSNINSLRDAEIAKAPAGSDVRVQSLNNGYYFYLYQTRQIKDIRIVYAPPRNIGVFGGDPDNFEWTRHTGDFTFLRAYVAPDGSAAEYSKENVPYQPKRFLKMNIGGVKENDFVFVLGYPGSTTRYRESQSIQYARDTNFPFLASFLDARSNALRLVGETDEEKRIALQSDIANFDNYRKVYDGGKLRLRRAQVVERRKTQEAEFANWVTADAGRQQKYGFVLKELAEASADSNAFAQRDVVLGRVPDSTTPTLAMIMRAVMMRDQPKPPTEEEREKFRAAIKTSLEAREPIYEREMIKFFLRSLADLPEGQKVDGIEKLFGSLQGDGRRKAEAEIAGWIAEGSYWNAEAIDGLFGPMTQEVRPERDSVIALAAALAKERTATAARGAAFAARIDRLRLLYQKGMAEMQRITPYPDANSTLRFTYGTVKGFRPREAEYRTPLTTIKGMIEKDTGVKPFDMPERLKDFQAAKDFGRFGTGDSVVVNMLSTNDIIGGNSGSPVLNANGEQVGLVFDGNYEGLGNDFFYDPDMNRTISVDIRFVLFVTEKFGGAGWILNEMTLVGGK